jgi:hypothetical protein
MLVSGHLPGKLASIISDIDHNPENARRIPGCVP